MAKNWHEVEPITLFTRISAIAAVAYVICTILLWVSTRRAANAAMMSAKAAKESAEATTIAADAGRKSADAAVEAAEASKKSTDLSVWRGKFGEPKTDNAVRAFALSALLIGRLRNLAAQPNELLFKTRNGTPWDAGLLVKRKLRPLLRSLGIQEAGLHAFRHSNASLMDALAVPMKVRQQRLGHSDVRLTMNVYTHVASQDDVKTAEQIANVLWSSVSKSKEEGLPENQEALFVQ